MGFARQVTRRAVLRASSRLLIVATGSTLFTLPRVAASQPFALRFAWEQQNIPTDQPSFVSPILTADFPFNALESRWDATVPPSASLDLAVRTSADGANWSAWQHLHADSHARSVGEAGTFGDLIIGAPAQFVQYAVNVAPGPAGEVPTLRSFVLTAVNTLTPPPETVFYTEAAGGITIVPRAGWGADEKLRFDKDNKEIWPPDYRAIKKVLVHHTVTRDPETDPRATLRAIYQYHAVSRGWGDIGYNFLIDQQGTIYEGRFGGDRVVGGHALQYNWGSIGIAILGDYTGHSITDATRASLLALIRTKASDLDPVGKSFFIDRDNVMNISGHRGVINTSCPGDAFYPQLNNVRRELKGLPLWPGDPKADPIAANPPDVTPPHASGSAVDATLTTVTWGSTSLFARELLAVQITVKNTGATPLAAQQPTPDYIYTEGDTYAKRGFAGTAGAARIAIGPELLASSDPPYRWGLGRTLQPGESTTVQVAIRMTTAQKSRFVATIIQEGGGPLDTDDAIQVSVQPNPADPATATTDATSKFFPETKHNVGPDFLKYWQANGGLAQFGYPVTELFSDVNTDDKKTYKVQYFERARFELHPENAGTPYAVELGRLGVIVTQARVAEKPFVPVARVADAADRRFFPEAGHTLSGAFKAYWDSHGGLAIFGFPLCEPFDEKSATDGKTYSVQYFERNRFEYHPENKDTPQEVQLGLLGAETLHQRGWLT
ncbi:MAG TPA: N-acetylmuramoyl-L-alanine amidase [Thermomicrobiales bacterium]